MSRDDGATRVKPCPECDGRGVIDSVTMAGDPCLRECPSCRRAASRPVPTSETPCCIQLGGERCSRHGPAVERPAPEGCAGCAARDERLEQTRRLASEVTTSLTWEWFARLCKALGVTDAGPNRR